MDDNNQIIGGQGGSLQPLQQTSDTRLIEKSLSQRWPIPDELRPKVAKVLGQIINDPETSRRNRIAASRALATLDALNMEQEKRDAGGEHLNVHMDGEIATIRERIVRKREEAVAERNGMNGVY